MNLPVGPAAMGRRGAGVEAGALHDFKNLLTVISGHSELLLARLKEDDPLWRSADAIRRAVESGVTLTAQWLADARRQAAPSETVELNDLVATVARMLDGPLGPAITLDLRFDEATGRVHVSRAEIEQVIVNLAINARDAMPGGGTLTIETGHLDVTVGAARRLSDPPPGNWSTLVVADTGFGMDPAVAARLFEPYFTTKPGRGTGLGLATAQTIVRRHGGDIAVTTAPGRGSSFRVYLPRVSDVEPQKNGAAHHAVAPNGDAVATANGRGTETILVIENDRELRGLMREVLELHGYTVFATATVDEGETVAFRHPGSIHLVISDILAPGRSPRTLLAQLRRSRPAVKTLYVSDLAEDEIGRRAGRLDGLLLRKPFAVGAFARCVREALDLPLER